MIKTGVGVALVATVMGSGAYFHNYKEKTYENLQAEILASQTTEEAQESNVAGFDYSSIPWKQMGYSDLQTYWNDIQEKRESIKGIADRYINSYGSKMTEEDKKNLRWHESRMLNAVYSDDFEAAYNDFNSLASQFVPKRAYVASTWSGGSAKDFIIYHESRGDYNARNGKYYGAYQMDESRLNGDYSKENQDRVAEQYVADRYGSWENAMAFWQSHGWY